MAKLVIYGCGRRDFIVVYLSRRNLVALLRTLDMPGFACTLVTANCFIGSERSDGFRLVVRAEDDDAHYAGSEPPSRMHPLTEAAIWGRRGRGSIA